MARKQHVNIEIDKLTNSIVNAISGDVLETEFNLVSKKEISKKDWLFDWHLELANKNNEVYKMTVKNNITVIQGLISFAIDNQYIFVNVVENAKFNRGKEKMYIGVGGNMFAFACKRSKEMGFDGFVAFKAKTALLKHYEDTLGAERTLGQRMYIGEEAANRLINQYFKDKKL